MAIKIGGLGSGLDTDSIVAEMVKAYSNEKVKLKKSQTMLGWKQESWATLNSKIKKLYTKSLANLKFSDQYAKKTTTISDSTIAKVVAGDSAVNGTQSLKVTQLAKAGYLTGGKLTKDVNGNDMNVTGSTTLADLGILAAGEKATLNVSVGGKSTNFDVSADTSVDNFIKSLNNSGVSANFDKTNKRIFMNVEKSGKDADFSLKSVDSNGLDVLSGLRLLTTDDVSDLANYDNLDQSKKDEIRLNEKNTLKASYQDRLNKEISNQARFEKDLELEKENANTYEDALEKYTKSVNDAGESNPEYDADIDAAMQKTGNDRKVALKSLTDSQAWKDKKTAAEEKLKQVASDSATQADKDQLAAEQKEAQKFLDKDLAVNNLNVTYANIDVYDSVIDTSKTNQDKYTDYVNDAGNILTNEAATNLTNKIKRAKETMTDLGTGAADYDTRPIRVKGQDAEIYLNGAQYTSSTNSFTVNNLTITAQEVSGNNEVSISTSDDVDGVYNVIKNFIKEYNSIIKDMDSLYNASSAKGYEPLTDEEKDAMSDEEVKNWEQKIKTSILRRDSTLGGNINLMKNAMMEGFMVNGTKYNLSSFGIETKGYFDTEDGERGMYHIAGDKDDTDAIDGKDKLKTLIATNKDDVVGFFTQLTDNMYKLVGKEMKGNDYRTHNTMYDDKKMKSDYEKLAIKIAEQDKKIARMEDKYYKQFTAMEVAMSKLNSQQSSLAGLLGG